MHEPMSSHPSARRPVFFGVFLMSMAVLVVQIVLTRIFSLTIRHHFTYVSISVALLVPLGLLMGKAQVGC